MKTWYTQLGFRANPLTVKPMAGDQHLLNLEELKKKVHNLLYLGSIVYLVGDMGTGKTTVIKWILKKSKNTLFYSCNRKERIINIEKIISTESSLIGKLMNTEKTILIFDESQEMNKRDYNNILKHYNQGSVKSILFVGSGIKDNMIPGEFKTGMKIFNIPTLTEQQAVQLIRHRMKNKKVLSDENIRKVFYCSDCNPRRFLLNCEDVHRHFIDRGFKDIDNGQIEEILENRS
ncbi:AAA family ATPase [Candidatus Woesearchaeota archaeon]|nr:AAA family ATPase [Candidatus Woesearchaeota archaeon]